MPIPMDPPTKYIAQLAAGKLIRYGAVLKDAQTGQIVGHLKEAGEMGSILSRLSMPPLGLANALNPLSFATDAIGHGINAYKLTGVQRSVDEVKTLVEGLQLATNVAALSSMAGLGVSVVGFAVVNNKLGEIDTKIDRLANDIGSIKMVLSDLSISWDAMSEAKFQTAAETLIVAEKAETESRQQELAKEAVSQFSLLRHYYAYLLRSKGIYEDVELDVDSLLELVARYTVACMGVLQAEFMTGDLGAYRTRLDSILSEYSDLVSFEAKSLYLSRCDNFGALNLRVDHQQLSESLVSFSQVTQENIARLDSFEVELEYLVTNSLSVPQYLSALRNHETDLVLLPR